MSDNQLAQVGVIGMAVMGSNLARNFASKGFRTAIYNRTHARTQEVMNAHGAEGDFYEILLRMKGPKGEILPGYFFPIAEQHGLLPQLDRWVIANAIRALNKGARLGGFFHDTGEGSISPYHREHGGDLVWELGSGYFGCRDAQGRFDPERFAVQAREAQVRMIEIKLSQGAKPGHGGILPKHKISAEIALTRGVAMDRDCVSPANHSEFSTPVELLQFIARLRELAGGKPVGFKLAIGHPWEWFGVAKAMLATGILPDFIVVDGSEGGTGAAPMEFTDHIGVPLREGLLFVHNTLVGTNLREHIRLGASGKIISAFDIASVLAIGADWVNSARGFMFAIGCIQSQSCHTNKCPTGVATQDPLRQRALVVEDKAQRVANYHRHTLRALGEMLAAAGLNHPSQLEARHLVRRVSSSEIKLFSQMHVLLKPGELLDGSVEGEFYRRMWQMAQADSFDALPG